MIKEEEEEGEKRASCLIKCKFNARIRITLLKNRQVTLLAFRLSFFTYHFGQRNPFKLLFKLPSKISDKKPANRKFQVQIKYMGQ